MSKENEQIIFDDETFFKSYMELRERDDNHNELLEQPAMKKLLPDMSGKAVLDLGCGCGHNCMDFVNSGAASVVGVDISEKMLERAREESNCEKIEYINMSMTNIKKLGRKFDVIYSSLAFHYIEDFAAFAEDMYSVLNSGGYLLFSQEHPLNTATDGGNGHYNRDEDGNRISYTFSNYNQPGKRVIKWVVDGVIKYHRTFSNIINAIVSAGFIIETVEEPVPEQWAIEKRPDIIKEFIKPCFIIVKAKKVSSPC